MPDDIKFEEGVENISAAVKELRPIREHGPYGILIGDETLQFKGVVIADPVPTGQQIVLAAGVRQTTEYLVYQMLPDGQLEEIRPEETTDLRANGAEKFLVFRSDRSFRFLLDDRAIDWGSSQITGATLKKLAGVDLETNDVLLRKENADQLISDSGFSDLSLPGVERFYTKGIALTIIINARERVVNKRRLSYWEVVKLAEPNAMPSETTEYTVTYGNGPASNPEGSLVEGQSVNIKERMKFYVTPTDKS